MPLGPNERTEIQSQNAHSRELNSSTRNPFYGSEKIPAATECAIEKRQAHAEAWEADWEMEDGIRTPEELAAIMISLGA